MITLFSILIKLLSVKAIIIATTKATIIVKDKLLKAKYFPLSCLNEHNPNINNEIIIDSKFFSPRMLSWFLLQPS